MNGDSCKQTAVMRVICVSWRRRVFVIVSLSAGTHYLPRTSCNACW